MRLQNIRFPEPDICREEELYFHRNGEWIDFNGYFNLFYIWKIFYYDLFRKLIDRGSISFLDL